MTKGDFKKASGVIPWKEGDEMSEHIIRRLRDGGEDMGPYYYRKWIEATAKIAELEDAIQFLKDNWGLLGIIEEEYEQ